MSIPSWYELSTRFRKLGQITDMGKVHSYDIDVNFNGSLGQVTVHMFTYDIADWDRHTHLGYFDTDEEARAVTLAKIIEAEKAVTLEEVDGPDRVLNLLFPQE